MHHRNSMRTWKSRRLVTSSRIFSCTSTLWTGYWQAKQPFLLSTLTSSEMSNSILTSKQPLMAFSSPAVHRTTSSASPKEFTVWPETTTLECIFAQVNVTISTAMKIAAGQDNNPPARSVKKQLAANQESLIQSIVSKKEQRELILLCLLIRVANFMYTAWQLRQITGRCKEITSKLRSIVWRRYQWLR